jgi:hypothetical protein
VNQSPKNSFASFLGSLIGLLVLVCLYARALIWPQEYAQFVFRMGMMIFVIEFISIHSSGILSGTKNNKLKDNNWNWAKMPSKLFLICLYGLFVFASMFALQSWLIGIVFFISLSQKILINRFIEEKERKIQILFPVINLFASVFIAELIGPFLKSSFPISSEISSQWTKGTSGSWVETPQKLLAWGILYFSFTIAFNIFIYIRYNWRSGRHAPPNCNLLI